MKTIKLSPDNALFHLVVMGAGVGFCVAGNGSVGFSLMGLGFTLLYF